MIVSNDHYITKANQDKLLGYASIISTTFESSEDMIKKLSHYEEALADSVDLLFVARLSDNDSSGHVYATKSLPEFILQDAPTFFKYAEVGSPFVTDILIGETEYYAAFSPLKAGFGRGMFISAATMKATNRVVLQYYIFSTVAIAAIMLLIMILVGLFVGGYMATAIESLRLELDKIASEGSEFTSDLAISESVILKEVFAVVSAERRKAKIVHLETQSNLIALKEKLERSTYNKNMVLESSLKDVEMQLEELRYKQKNVERIAVQQAHYTLLGLHVDSFIETWSAKFEHTVSQFADIQRAHREGSLTAETLANFDLDVQAWTKNFIQALNDFVYYLERDNTLEMIDLSRACVRAIVFVDQLVLLKDLSIEIVHADEIFVKGYFREISMLVASAFITIAKILDGAGCTSMEVKLLNSDGRPSIQICTVDCTLDEERVAENKRALDVVNLYLDSKFHGRFELGGEDDNFACALTF
jgi:hypothetical protein